MLLKHVVIFYLMYSRFYATLYTAFFSLASTSIVYKKLGLHFCDTLVSRRRRAGRSSGVGEVVETVAAAAVHRCVRIGRRGIAGVDRHRATVRVRARICIRVGIRVGIGGSGGGGGGGRAGDAEAVETVFARGADQRVLATGADVVHALHVRAVQQNVRVAQRVSRTNALPVMRKETRRGRGNGGQCRCQCRRQCQCQCLLENATADPEETKKRGKTKAYLGFLLSRAVMSPLASSDSLFHTAGFTFRSPYERENGSGDC